MVRFAASFFLLAYSLASAQQAVNYATLGGIVSDPSGAVVEGADVTARQLATNISSTQKTGHDGRFRFEYLNVGDYEVSVRHEGFQEATRPLTLTVAADFDLAFSLLVGQSSTKVQVSDAAPLIESARTQVASTISQAEIQDLPLGGRSYFDIALFVPGVSPTNTASNQLFAETSAMPGQGLSVSSQRNFSNSFIIDGVSANDDAAGVAGTFVGVDVVQELQVVTSGGQAELGRALGGYVNVVTKSGGNNLHAALYGYLENSRFNAANPLNNQVLPLTQAQYGASLSGPVKHDKTFYFANYEARALNQSGLITIAPSAVAAINARLLAIGFPGPQIYTGDYRNPVHTENFFAKMDHHFSDRDQFSARYSLYHVESVNSRGAGGLSAATASANLLNTDQNVALSNVFTISPHVVNETRAQFTNGNLAAPPSDLVGPAVSISGVATFGTLSGSPTARVNRMFEGTDSISVQHGPNSFKAGADLLYNNDTITFPGANHGSYSFSSLANFLTGTYNSSGYSQTFGVFQVHQTNPNVGFYAQDEYKVSRRLTFNIGVRYDVEWLKTIATQNNVSPRAGFAWSPFGNSRTVVRGGFGLFYDRIPLRPLANALLSAQNTIVPSNLQKVSVIFTAGQTGAPVFPNVLNALAIPAGTLFTLSTMDPNIKSASSQQGSLEIEQQVGRTGKFTVGYQHVRGLHLIASINQNVPTCAAAGTNNGCRPNPNFGNDSQYSGAADSHYDGAHVSFLQQPVKWGNYRVSYTYSKALDDVSEFFFSAPMNMYNIWQDYSRADDDQRSRLSFEGSVHTSMDHATTNWERLSHGFQVTASLTAYSPLPFNLTTGANTIQGTGARPTLGGLFIGRNLGEYPSLINSNLRLSRTFGVSEKMRLQVLAEMFNAMNHVNVATLNGVFGAGTYPANPSPAFKQITAVNASRTAQFGLRLSF